ncbi:MAG: glycosyltransferase family 39 protein [Acidobacteria bacterium]|nr:glycosyltransferase family 39 protein [Acidobacteriota bacterium]
MDDVDATYAQIARQMLETGDWVTARLDGVVYFDKPPGQVWAMAASYALFGVSAWAARIPLALACVLLCWVTLRFGRWAFGEPSGSWAATALAGSVGLWLFSRMRIPDPALTLTITVSLYAAMRLLEGDVRRPRLWSALLGAALGVGVLWKGLPALVFPGAALFLYLLATRNLLDPGSWRRLRLAWAGAACLLIAAPWHIAAILRNPPYFDFAMTSEPGVYRGFFWRYFINEHVLRYLGLRYPKDYNTVPQTFFWLGHLLWLFPFSAFLPAVATLPFRPADRAGRVRILCLCWLGFVLLFFALSTSQEYYTMAAYPALALLLGDAVARGGALVRWGRLALGATAALACAACLGLLIATVGVETTGDIAGSLSSNPEAYTLALGHMQDLTLESFAWLRGPLALAALAFGVGAASCFRGRLAGAAVMMLLFFHAARWAMVSFDPYLSSKPLADAYLAAPPGRLVLDDQYYSFSSVVFYTNQRVLLLNGRVNNIEYGSNAPGAPHVFLDDAAFQELWTGLQPVYIATFVERLDSLPPGRVVASAGGKILLTNR